MRPSGLSFAAALALAAVAAPAMSEVAVATVPSWPGRQLALKGFGAGPKRRDGKPKGSPRDKTRAKTKAASKARKAQRMRAKGKR